MAINLANKFAGKVDERFRVKSLTDVGVNKDFEWTGVSTINVLTLTAQALNDYNRTAGSDRFGTPAELQDTKQDMELTRDRGNSIIVDRGNNLQQHNLKTAGSVLAMQVDEIVVPEVDAYRLATMNTAAAGNSKRFGTAASTTTDAYANLLELQESLSDDKTPLSKRVAFVTPAYHSVLKQDDSFIKNSDLAYKNLVNGQVGEVDGVRIVVVPSSYLPLNTEMVLAHKSVTVAAEQLKNYKVHQDPPGISGMQIDYRIIYDAFVRTPKVDGVASRATSV